MGVDGRSSMYPSGCPKRIRNDAMPKQSTATAFDHDSTLVLALELSGKGWKAEVLRAGRTVRRTVLAYEAGRDGFWIARYLLACGIEVQILHPASIPVERRGRRVKTDRIDLDMLLRTLLAWLRGEPRVCTMVRVPSVEEEDARRPGRERDKLVRERVGLENQIRVCCACKGLATSGRAAEKLERSGAALPAQTMAQLRRLMKRHSVASEQIAEIDASRVAEVDAPDPDRGIGMI